MLGSSSRRVKPQPYGSDALLKWNGPALATSRIAHEQSNRGDTRCAGRANGGNPIERHAADSHDRHSNLRSDRRKPFRPEQRILPAGLLRFGTPDGPGDKVIDVGRDGDRLFNAVNGSPDQQPAWRHATHRARRHRVATQMDACRPRCDRHVEAIVDDDTALRAACHRDNFFDELVQFGGFEISLPNLEDIDAGIDRGPGLPQQTTGVPRQTPPIGHEVDGQGPTCVSAS